MDDGDVWPASISDCRVASVRREGKETGQLSARPDL